MIACAFGAIVLLVLILPIGTIALDRPEGFELESHARLLYVIDALEEEIAVLRREVSENHSLLVQVESDTETAAAANKSLETTIAKTQSKSQKVRSDLSALETKRSLLAQEQSAVDKKQQISTEVSGIPVDSEYLAFVVDTSGSMHMMWDDVLDEIERFWSVYPELKGYQVLSDNGHYLYKYQAKKWIKDTPTARKRALRLMRTWSAWSNSSPVEGITKAIDDLYRDDIKMAIVVVGDDYAGSDFDDLLDTIDSKVHDENVGKGTLRIHAMGFWNPEGSLSPLNFSVLMRELTIRHNGAFLALEKRDGDLVSDITRDGDIPQPGHLP